MSSLAIGARDAGNEKWNDPERNHPSWWFPSREFVGFPHSLLSTSKVSRLRRRGQLSEARRRHLCGCGICAPLPPLQHRVGNLGLRADLEGEFPSSLISCSMPFLCRCISVGPRYNGRGFLSQVLCPSQMECIGQDLQIWERDWHALRLPWDPKRS